jgi:hypothetical protein
MAKVIINRGLSASPGPAYGFECFYIPLADPVDQGIFAGTIHKQADGQLVGGPGVVPDVRMFEEKDRLKFGQGGPLIAIQLGQALPQYLLF